MVKILELKCRFKIVAAPALISQISQNWTFPDLISRSVMNGASPAHSLVSTTAVAGGGGSSGAAAGLDDFHFPPDIPSMQDRKDEAMRVLKADLMAELDKEVKSLEEDSWMFEGPRSRIHLISRRGNFLKKEGVAVSKSSIIQLPR